VTVSGAGARTLGDRGMVDGARGDAKAGAAQRRNERFAEKEVLDAHPAHADRRRLAPRSDWVKFARFRDSLRAERACATGAPRAV
jgi:hypothetical protein